MTTRPAVMQPSAVLGCRNVSKNFGETKALSDVSISFMAGHVHSVLGENGSGKSTLAKAVSGVLAVDSGDIIVSGDPLSGALDPRRLLKRGVAIVLQEVLVLPNRTVVENVLLGQEGVFTGKIPRGEKRRLAADLLGRLTDRQIALDALAADLPLHEQQIVVIARGLASAPRVLILDEATAALDLSDRSKLFAELKRFCGEGGTVVFVSHRMPEIIELSDHVHIMQNGHLIAELSGAEITPSNLIQRLTQDTTDA